ncbi:hypothetical protein [Streptomyces sp. NPDC051135]|uniref:hypothetical protein n=1 Tax=unclassified Streptomyces TaxID=2593676 RepID=UPI003429E719
MVMDVTGTWHLKQSNGPLVEMRITGQDENGTFADQGNASFDGVSGPLKDARATDTEITFQVPWSNGPVGRYVGRFDFQGRLTGVTFAEGNPSQQAQWVVDEKTFGAK